MSKRFSHGRTVWSRMNGLVMDEWFEQYVNSFVMRERFGQGRTVWLRVNGLVTGERFGYSWMVWS